MASKILNGDHYHYWDARCKFTKNIISDSSTLSTQSMDGTLDQHSIIIDATPDIKLILGGGLYQIQ